MRVLVCDDDPVLKLVSLKNTCTACPSQWEGTLEDGRAIYARYRHGELSVGVGNDINEAVRNGMSDQALYANGIGNGLDGFMDFQELKAQLHGLLEFPADLDEHDRRPKLRSRNAGKAARASRRTIR
jgi:hypothetical protein